MTGMTWAVEAAERGWIPDRLLRTGIRRLCRGRLRVEGEQASGRDGEVRQAFIDRMNGGPVAPVPEKANEQHYELPAEFFAKVLGPQRKYSCCFWGDGVDTLAEAERLALEITCQRAELADGQSILELGCGWGSLSLWMARKLPHSRITAVSNSAPQRESIEAAAARDGIRNLRVITADMNRFAPVGRFDRVVSVEMFEHMRNYRRLMQRISGWLEPRGRLFVHLFSHRRLAYAFETEGEEDWMGRNFFTGGIMPSDDLLPHFQDDLRLLQQWRWNGRHYEKTANAWLANLDARRSELLPVLAEVYGPSEARRWCERWRIFFLACAELFGYARGEEWGVSHYLFENRDPASPA